MDDESIIWLYWERDERAIEITAEKYGPYCGAIAGNILGSREDREECLNDTYIRAWNSMPKDWPGLLQAYLGRMTRNLAFNRYKRERAKKRGGGEADLVLEELSECVSGAESVEGAMDRRELIEAIGVFVRGLPENKRSIFVRRYWYADSLKELAEARGAVPARLSERLYRMRLSLKSTLEKEGVIL